MVKMNVGCLVYYWGERYEKIGKIAVDSFKKFHPDVTLHHIDDRTRENYSSSKFIKEYGTAVHKFMLAYEIMIKHKYDRIIILGADTITCSRFDEFLGGKINFGSPANLDKYDVITTLDYPYQVSLPYKFDTPITASSARSIPANTVFTVNTPIVLLDQDKNLRLTGAFVDHIKDEEDPVEYLHVNADIVCFCDPKALKKVISTTVRYHNLFFGKEAAHWPANVWLTEAFYAEQGGLNIFCSFSINPHIEEYNYSIGFADAPYSRSDCVYNARAKGNISAKAGEKPWGPFLNKWSVKNNKLYDSHGKQIKAYHYCEGLGGMTDTDFKSVINTYIFEWFNDDTKKFFKKHCETEDFFEKEFSF